MYGVNSAHPQAQDYFDSLFELFASWDVDYIKIDDICNTNMYPNAPYSAQGEIELINQAIENCGRPMVLSLSPGPAQIDKAWHLSRYANMWRITDDFWDRWDLLKDMFQRCQLWQKHVQPGCWPDCDMLPLGQIGIGFKKPRKSNFTKDEQRTMMTLWCIFRSPLMMGGVLPDNDEWTLSLLTNEEVLAVQKHGTNPEQIRLNDKEAVWKNSAGTSESSNTGKQNNTFNLALFNLSDEKRIVNCPLSELGLEKAALRDLWEKKDMGIVNKEVSIELPPHGAVLYRVTGI